MVVTDAAAAAELVCREGLGPHRSIGQQQRNTADSTCRQLVDQATQKGVADALACVVRQHPEAQDPGVVPLHLGDCGTNQRAVALGDQPQVICGESVDHLAEWEHRRMMADGSFVPQRHRSIEVALLEGPDADSVREGPL